MRGREKKNEKYIKYSFYPSKALLHCYTHLPYPLWLHLWHHLVHDGAYLKGQLNVMNCDFITFHVHFLEGTHWMSDSICSLEFMLYITVLIFFFFNNLLFLNHNSILSFPFCCSFMSGPDYKIWWRSTERFYPDSLLGPLCVQKPKEGFRWKNSSISSLFLVLC